MDTSTIVSAVGFGVCLEHFLSLMTFRLKQPIELRRFIMGLPVLQCFTSVFGHQSPILALLGEILAQCVLLRAVVFPLVLCAVLAAWCVQLSRVEALYVVESSSVWQDACYVQKTAHTNAATGGTRDCARRMTKKINIKGKKMNTESKMGRWLDERQACFSEPYNPSWRISCISWIRHLWRRCLSRWQAAIVAPSRTHFILCNTASRCN